jgi:hypothetical protein
VRGAVRMDVEHVGARHRLPSHGRAEVPRGRVRLRREAQHPADARAARLPAHGRPRDDVGRGRDEAQARRRVPVQRPGRPRAVHLRDRGDPRHRGDRARRRSAFASATSCSASRRAGAR